MCFPRQFISQFILPHPPLKKYAGESSRLHSCLLFPSKKGEENRSAGFPRLFNYAYCVSTTLAHRGQSVGCASLWPISFETVQQRSHFSPSAFSTTTAASFNFNAFSGASAPPN